MITSGMLGLHLEKKRSKLDLNFIFVQGKAEGNHLSKIWFSTSEQLPCFAPILLYLSILGKLIKKNSENSNMYQKSKIPELPILLMAKQKNKIFSENTFPFRRQQVHNSISNLSFWTLKFKPLYIVSATWISTLQFLVELTSL